MMKKTDAAAIPGTGTQGDNAGGNTVLHRYPEKITAEPIPTPETVKAAAIADLQHKLARIAEITDPATAKAAVYDVLDSGWHTVDPRELIRAVEIRLPRPTATQLDAATLRRSKTTGQIFAARALGALGDHVLILTADNPDGRPYYIRIATIPQRQPITTAAWDITRPKTRRTYSPIIDADNRLTYSPIPPWNRRTYSPIIDADNRRTYSPIPTGRMIIC